MKTIFATLFSVATLSLSGFSQDESSSQSATVPASNLKVEVLSLDWTQCEGRFHYTFSTNGFFTLDGTIMGGSWSVEGDHLVLRWSGNWVVDHLKFDAANRLFVHTKGEKFNIMGAAPTVPLALNGAQ